MLLRVLVISQLSSADSADTGMQLSAPGEVLWSDLNAAAG